MILQQAQLPLEAELLGRVTPQMFAVKHVTIYMSETRLVGVGVTLNIQHLHCNASKDKYWSGIVPDLKRIISTMEKPNRPKRTQGDFSNCAAPK